MTRYVAIIIAVWMFAGCRAPVPSFDFLAPYGSPTVPSPRTGAIGTSGTYYSPTTPGTAAPGTLPAATAPLVPSGPAATAPSFPPPSQPLVPPASYMGASNAPLADATSSVALASFQAGVPHPVTPPATTVTTVTTVTDESLPTDARAETASRPSDSSSTLNLRGMPVNDATASAEPQASSSAGEPANSSSSNSPSFLRFINSKPGASSGTVTAVPPTTTAPAAVWQTR
ncbi:MAG: hypothetical protein ACYC3X_12525 [Pirellulaceae bacterium]